MNGERPQTNGQHVLNGSTSTQHHQATEAKIARSAAGPSHGPTSKSEPLEPHTNGVHANESRKPDSRVTANRLDQAPLEVLQLVSKEHFLPIASVISRRAQTCWNALSTLVDDLSNIQVPPQTLDPRLNGSPVENLSKPNLDKKDRILSFAKDQKDDFVKLLVLLEWSKTADDVANTISLNRWITDQRQTYWWATNALAVLRRDSVTFQIPNPDIKTAGEVLSTGRASSVPNIGYQETKLLSSKQILAILKKLNRALGLRLSVEQELPLRLRSYTIHDGRVTFVVPDEFELDLSILDESPESAFRVVDFRYAFKPRPAIPDYLRGEVEQLANGQIDTNGLEGCYRLLHELTLSNKLIEFHKQALDLARDHWLGHIKVELLRRNLVIQYWSERTAPKSWVDIGINSGRSEDAVTNDSYLAIRWFREGKEVADVDIELNLAQLSLETVFLQLVARHASWILSSVYDRLIELPLFDESGLHVVLSSSDTQPDNCFLQLQLGRKQEVLAALDSVTGIVKITPTSEHANRLEAELNRSKNLTTEFVPKLLNYRCVVAESVVRDTIADTAWERLSAFRPGASDVRAVFASSVARVSFFRHPSWSKEYLFATTHGLESDDLWILYQAPSRSTVSFAGSEVLHRETILLHDELSSEYFESFANYASCIIVLHSNAAALRNMSWKYQFPHIPDFRQQKVPDALSFDLGAKTHSLHDATSGFGSTSIQFAHSKTVRIQYMNVNTISKDARLTATIQSDADANVLQRLSASNPDPRITFAPKERRIIFELSTPVGKSAIDEIVHQVTRIHDLTACIQTVQSLTTMTLISISMTEMTIDYQLGESKDRSMTIQFPAGQHAPRIEFRPDTNPHLHLASSLSRLLNNSSRPFALNLRNAISSLVLADPLITTLHEMQSSLQSGVADIGNSPNNKIQMHILVRQPTMFALQYFMVATAKPAVLTAQQRLLARFEILPSASDNKNMWILRPAIDEYQSYSRASFAAASLQAKVKQEIFGKVHRDWMRLDNAALCLADNPKPLLKAVEQAMVAWVDRGGEQPEAPTIVQPTQQVPAPTQTPAQQKKSHQGTPAAPLNTNAHRRPTPKQTASQQRIPNGASSQQQRGRPQIPPKNKEVITLD